MLTGLLNFHLTPLHSQALGVTAQPLSEGSSEELKTHQPLTCMLPPYAKMGDCLLKKDSVGFSVSQYNIKMPRIQLKIPHHTNHQENHYLSERDNQQTPTLR